LFNNYLLDTCALLWWTLQPKKLSAVARKATKRVEDGAPAFVSSMSFWEIGIKAKRHHIELGTSFADYVERVKSMQLVEILPVDLPIWQENVALDWDHRDPVDRTIVASARLHQLSIVTCDREIRNFFPKCIW